LLGKLKRYLCEQQLGRIWFEPADGPDQKYGNNNGEKSRLVLSGEKMSGA